MPEEDFRIDNSIVRCRMSDKVLEPASKREVPVADVISRHVKQVADFNKALEKRRLWRKREKELEAKHKDTCTVQSVEERGTTELRFVELLLHYQYCS